MSHRAKDVVHVTGSPGQVHIGDFAVFNHAVLARHAIAGQIIFKIRDRQCHFRREMPDAWRGRAVGLSWPLAARIWGYPAPVAVTTTSWKTGAAAFDKTRRR